jgi:hypothetical protein
LTKHFNTVSSWVSTEIVREEKANVRAKNIARFVMICKVGDEECSFATVAAAAVVVYSFAFFLCSIV